MTLSRASLAGAICLVAAPPVVIVSALVAPTMSDEAADQASALADHRNAVIAGLTINTLSLVLLIGGTIWLALTTARRSPKLAIAGGILGVLGSLVILFENGIDAAAPSVVRGMDAGQASAALDRIASSAAVAGLGPVTVLGNLGLILLAVAALRIGVDRWAAAAFALGAVGEGIGFATGTRVLVIAAFVVFFVGAVAIVRVATAGATAPDATMKRHPASEQLAV